LERAYTSNSTAAGIIYSATGFAAIHLFLLL